MEQEVKQNQEEYYAVVCWENQNGRTKIVGTLAYFEGKYYFKYEQTAINEILNENPVFTGVAGFDLGDELTISENALFTFFQLRVQPEIREKPEALRVLIETRGKSQTDSISVMPVPKTYQSAIKAEIQRIEKNQIEARQQKAKQEGLDK